jgi:hypothetical protein
MVPPMVRLAMLGLLLALAPLRAEEPLPLANALEAKRVTLNATGNGRHVLHLQITAPAKLRVAIPSGAQFRSDNGELQVGLRTLVVEVGPGVDVDAILPAAALHSGNSASERPVSFIGTVEPKLAKLFELFTQQNDLPRQTAQLAILILQEDITWPQWKKWLEPAWNTEKPAKSHPTPAEVAQAVDAIAFARLAAPEAKFTILADEDLKRVALRNPWARGKAMALYGLSVEDALTGDSSLPVDLGKLLHTSPNDNCPICRQRTRGPADIP